MVYVTSDLHGYPPEAFMKLLDRAGFTGDDFLFVLGDVIDRGEYGAELLLWLTEQPNVQLIRETTKLCSLPAVSCLKK